MDDSESCKRINELETPTQAKDVVIREDGSFIVSSGGEYYSYAADGTYICTLNKEDNMTKFKVEVEAVDDIVIQELMIQLGIFKGYVTDINKGMSPNVFHAGAPEYDLVEIQEHIKAYERVLDDFTEHSLKGGEDNTAEFTEREQRVIDRVSTGGNWHE